MVGFGGVDGALEAGVERHVLVVKVEAGPDQGVVEGVLAGEVAVEHFTVGFLVEELGRRIHLLARAEGEAVKQAGEGGPTRG